MCCWMAPARTAAQINYTGLLAAAPAGTTGSSIPPETSCICDTSGPTVSPGAILPTGRRTQT